MSKANQAFKQNDEAVSPVIGVILMVAITVVLAAVVFVLVSNLGKGSDKAPAFSLTKDDNLDRLSVVSADSDADWNRLSVSVTGGSPTALQMGANHATDAAACTGADAFVTDICVTTTAVEVTGTANPMGAGEYLEFCDTAVASSITVQIVDSAANSVIGSFTFQTIGACA